MKYRVELYFAGTATVTVYDSPGPEQAKSVAVELLDGQFASCYYADCLDITPVHATLEIE